MAEVAEELGITKHLFDRSTSTAEQSGAGSRTIRPGEGNDNDAHEEDGRSCVPRTYGPEYDAGMSSQREVTEHIERARQFYDDPNTIHAMRSDEMFSVGHWHTEFYVEPPDVGRIDENAYMALRLGTSSRSHILDFSCGVGGFCRRMVESYACTMSGLNLSAEQVAWARRENSLNGQIEFKSYDGRTFPFAAAQFDGVSSQETLCQIPNRDEIFRELFRVLKPSAKICIQDWFMAEGLERERLVEWVQPVDEAFATKVSTMSEYETLLRAAGFVDVETCRASDLPGFALRHNGRGVTDPGMLQRCHAVGRAFENGTMLVGFVSASKPDGVVLLG